MDSDTMKGKEPKDKPKKGRPVTRTMPEPIPDTPENIANACMQDSPKQEWRYIKKRDGS